MMFLSPLPSPSLKINKIFIYLFILLQRTLKKIKRQPSELESIFANHIAHNGLVSRISKVFLQCNNEKINYPVRQNGQRTRIFQRRYTDKYMKRCSTSLVIREKQNHNEIALHAY